MNHFTHSTTPYGTVTQAVYENRRVKCGTCNGSGKYWVEETKTHYYEPDREARQSNQSSDSCFVATACVMKKAAFRLVFIMRS